MDKIRVRSNNVSVLARRIVASITNDMQRKMVLLSGPRQCGKTTLVKAITRARRGVYMSWDDPADRRIAMHLVRWVDWAREVEGVPLELRYFRTRTGHEVDFVILRQRKPWIAIEAKLTEGPIEAGLRYLLERTSIPHAFQVSATRGRERRGDDIGRTRVRHVWAGRLLASLP